MCNMMGNLFFRGSYYISVIGKALGGRKIEQKYELKCSAFCFGVVAVSSLCNMTGFNAERWWIAALW